jgi:hypothetical protein
MACSKNISRLSLNTNNSIMFNEDPAWLDLDFDVSSALSDCRNQGASQGG